MRWSAAIAFVTFAACTACQAPPSQLPPGVALRYGVSYMGGSTSLEVKADGAAEYTSTRGPEGEKHVRSTATPAEIRAVVEVLRKSSFCSLTSGRSTGIPVLPTVKTACPQRGIVAH